MQPGDSVPDDSALPQRRPLPIVPELPSPQQPPPAVDPGLAALLDALAGAAAGVDRTADHSVEPRNDGRKRLFERIARSAQATRLMVTVRHKDARLSWPAPGVEARLLYEAGGARLRRGEPSLVRWIELSPGARWRGDWPASGLQRECLVIRGRVRIGSTPLEALDYHVVPPGLGIDEITSESGATLYWREAPQSSGTNGSATNASVTHGSAWPLTTLYARGEWSAFAPGIRRRVLWAQGSEAAMLYHAMPGATVPRHAHSHDEECLMLEGELFLDEVLLRAGEYQLAPAGTGHQGLSTDTGVVIYAHGDLDLDLIDL